MSITTGASLHCALLVPIPVTLVQPQDKSSQQLAWYQAAIFLHPGSAAGECLRLVASNHQHVAIAITDLSSTCHLPCHSGDG